MQIHSRITFDPDDTVFLHGDITPGNVYLHDGHVVCLADYEWARFGPRDAELALLGFWIDAQDPSRPSEDRGRMMTWLLADYPELADVSGFDDRRRMFRIAFALRTLLTWPPDGPEPGLDRWHPARQLRSLVSSRASIRV